MNMKNCEPTSFDAAGKTTIVLSSDVAETAYGDVIRANYQSVYLPDSPTGRCVNAAFTLAKHSMTVRFQNREKFCYLTFSLDSTPLLSYLF